MDHREPLKIQSVLKLGSENFVIQQLIGYGGNAMVYLAEYEDNLHKGHFHRVLIKELFPFHPRKLIFRENGKIRVKDEALFELHKESFLRGNSANINLLYKEGDGVSQNVNSYEANGTLYTVLGYSSGQILEEAMGDFKTLREITGLIIAIFENLKVFHKNNLLHLDISPDNIWLLPKNKSEAFGKVLLIDYNSSWELEGKTGHTGTYYSIKQHYSAFEIRLHDYERISFATDIFSVCAIFLELLQGEPMTLDEFDKRKLTKLKIFENTEKPVVHKTISILSKGLRAVSKNRYQTIDAVLKDLEELLGRIDGKGVTHSSLWEISHRQYKDCDFEILENHIKIEGQEMAIDAIVGYKNVMLTGSGGMGKTTVLMDIWKKSLVRYDPKEPVCIYIPLYKYGGSPYFIHQFILEKIKFDSSMGTLEDASHALNKWLETNAKRMTLLLDGINEANADLKELAREIEDFAKWPSVNVIVTARNQNQGLDGFKTAVLLPLTDDITKDYLNKNGLPYPGDEKLTELIRNPMMLSLYTKTQKIWAQSPESKLLKDNTAADIISDYLESLVQGQKLTAAGDEVKQLRVKFIIEHLLPQIAAAMKNDMTISFEQLCKVVMKNYKLLKSKAFALSFKEYAGKSRQILEGIKDEREWLDYAVCDVLEKELALVVIDPKSCRLIHQNFWDSLKEKNEKLKKQYRSVWRRHYVPKMLLGLLAALVLFAAGFMMIPKSFPHTADEKAMNTIAVNGIINSVMGLDEQIRNEKKMLDALTVNAIKETEGKNDLLNYTQPVDSSSFKNTPLSIELLDDIYKAPEKHHVWQKDMLGRMAKLFDENGIYTEAHKEEAIANYKEYLMVYETLVAAKILKVMQPINEVGRAELLKALKYSAPLGKAYFDLGEMPADKVDALIAQQQSQLTLLELKLDKIRVVK